MDSVPGGPAVGQIVHMASAQGPVAYRCTEVGHPSTGIWTYTLVPVPADDPEA
jgi:hypothetical protein